MAALFPDNTFVAPKLPHPDRDLVRLVIAEAPGKEEQEKGEPLVGGSGRIFDSLLRSARINRAGLTIINTIQCRPPDNVYPTSSDAKSYIAKQEGIRAINQCITYHVLPIIRSRNWNRIDLLGDRALEHIALKKGIFKWRGSPLDIDPDAIEEAHK